MWDGRSERALRSGERWVFKVAVALQNSTVHAPYEHNAPNIGLTAQIPPSDSRSERSSEPTCLKEALPARMDSRAMSRALWQDNGDRIMTTVDKP